MLFLPAVLFANLFPEINKMTLRAGTNAMLICLLLVNSTTMKAQTNCSGIEGNYFLTGVHEVASVLVLKPDQTFDFFYTYGAVDRTGRGIWKITRDDSSKVVLCSKLRPGADFALVKKASTPDDHTLIRITDKHPEMLRYITVRIHTKHGIKDKFTDARGTVVIGRQPVQKIELMFELCPDRFSSFVISDQRLNHFEFKLEPWITDIFFENLTLTIGHNRLTGSHPLSNGNYYYVRSDKSTQAPQTP